MRTEYQNSERFHLHETIQQLECRINHLETMLFNFRALIDSLSITVHHLAVHQIKKQDK